MFSYKIFTHFLLGLLLTLSPFLCCKAQQTEDYIIRGNVIDAHSKEALAFVSILINDHPHHGTSTDIDGRFFITSEEPITRLTFSYVGYEKKIYDVQKENIAEPLTISLSQNDIALQEIEVVAGENPADILMRKVIANKDRHNPMKQGAFTYQTYTKLIADVLPDYEQLNKVQSQKIKQRFEKQHLMIMESTTERRFMLPGLSEEKVLASRVSGFKDPAFAALATDIQPFGLYDTYIKILDKNFLNPISKGSIRQYFFNIKDTLFTPENDSVFVLTFQARKNKNFDALKGLLYIHSKDYALQNIIAKPQDRGLINIKIQQQYEWINKQQWFPVQLSYELTAPDYPNKNMGVKMESKSYVHNIKLNLDTELKKKDFGLEEISMTKDAGIKDTAYWSSQRLYPLNPKEQNTYRIIDSLGNHYKFDRLLQAIEVINTGKLSYKFIDIDLMDLARYNEHEGLRLGLDLTTNKRLSPYFSLGAYIAYGFKDKAIKYGGFMDFTPFPNTDFKIRGLYRKDVSEPAIPEYFKNHFRGFRSYLVYRMEGINQQSIQVEGRLWRYLQYRTGLKNQQNTILYPHAYLNDYGDTIKQYDLREINFRLRFAYKEKYVSALRKRMAIEQPYPVLQFSFAKNLTAGKGNFTYNRYILSLEHSFTIKQLGQMSFLVEAGWATGILPYYLLFNGMGSYDKQEWVIARNTFQTMRLYEFRNDRYVSLFFQHNFKSLLFKKGKFKPELILAHNTGWGQLKQPVSGTYLWLDEEQSIPSSSLEKVYLESGLLIDNLVRLKYFNLFYLGLGAGFFYRYGAYRLNKPIDNMAFKLGLKFSF